MSVNIKTSTGLLVIAGSTILLDGTAAEFRTGVFTQSAPASGTSTQVITFDAPMPDTDYLVEFTANQTTLSGIQVQAANKTETGFTAILFNNYAQDYTPSFSYNAVSLVKLEGYTEVQNKVNNPGTVPTENSTDLITSGGVYTALQPLYPTSTVDNVTTLVNDEGKIKVTPEALVDDEFVETNEDKKITLPKPQRTWTGTYAEWQALSDAEKAKYEGGTVNITDDEAGTPEYYSTEEVKTNKVWIDGKPIYRRVFEIYKNGVLNNGWTRSGSTFTYTAGLDFIDTLISNVCLAGSILTSWSQATTNADYYNGIQRYGISSFRIINGGADSFAGTRATLILEYTKTTD